MCRKVSSKLTVCLLVAGIVLSLPIIAGAQIQKTMEAEIPVGDRNCWTPDCTPWHELWPQTCAVSHQDAWDDSNNDGCLSACDFIVLDGVRYHVDWVGPTFYFDGCDFILEPIDQWDPNNPICTQMIEVLPDNGRLRHIIEWHDGNNNDFVDPCDILIFEDGWQCHIVDIRLNIRITEVAPPDQCRLNCPAGDHQLTNPIGDGDKTPDLDFNGTVGVADFAIFAGCFGGYCYCADYDCSGSVNLVDFAYFAGHFNHFGPQPGWCP